MMSDEQFITSFWAHYILLEKELLDITKYVTIDADNFNTFSHSFAKIILQICSEIDVIVKEYCKFYDSSYIKRVMAAHIKFMREKNIYFANDKVNINNTKIVLNPWCLEKEDTVPSWWTMYNKIKHERYSIVTILNEKKYAYKFSTLKTSLYSLSALYILLINYYYNLSIKYSFKFQTPIPGSKLFSIIGSKWDNVQFYDSFALYLDDDGHLIQVNSIINY